MALFDEKDESLVKKFLYTKIEKESDADPEIMTDYILVTLQNEMSESELKAHCMADLKEFFGDQTSVFVSSLFDALGRKQYLPNTDDKPATGEQQRRTGESGQSSQPRRSRSPDRQRDRQRGRSRSPSRERRMPAQSSAHDMTMLNGPLEPTMGGPQMLASNPQHRRRKPCFDFLRKGSCLRGDSCMYAHVTPEQAYMLGMVAPANGGAFVPMQMQQRGGPLAMGQQRPPGGFYPMGMRPPHPPGMMQGSDAGVPLSMTAVYVTNIPDEFMGEDSIREFFGRFGGIQEVRIDASRHAAVVEYGDNMAQTQALNTPDAIFNNRFVRVHKARQHHSANGDTGHQQHSRAPLVPPQAAAPVWRPKSATIKKAEMIEKYVEQQKDLMKKLTENKDMPPATRKIIMDSINQIQTKIDDIRRPAPQPAKESGETADAPSTESPQQQPSAAVSAVEAEKQALQAKLKALQMEAARLGGGRGGSRGGRGGRGGAFAASSHHGSMSLDKRPRTLVLRNVGQAAAERLDSEMAQFGEIEHIDKAEDRNDPPFTYTVKFRARWEAEAAMKAVALLDGFSDVTTDWDQ
ncbi:hypothetical protein GGI20_003458 [Coemansia sp. BCRC 34301]|nr:hypothetical protein GGI20_003458 [Coemansia sp. BCRC 34301]